MKRFIYLVHRWGGVAAALLMALWFVSGLVIVFAEPPTPTRAQLLAHAELLAPQPGWLSAGQAWDASAAQRLELARRRAPRAPAPGAAAGGGAPAAPAPDLVQARLVRQAGEPRWLVEDGRGQRLALSAIDGAVHRTTPEEAARIARSWTAGDGGGAVRFLETVEGSTLLRNAEALRPFHRVALEEGDGADRELLVSSVTGEVVHASTRLQRALAWAGSWVHLFRPLELFGATNDTRVATLEWTAFLAVLATLTGLVVGWLRWRPGWFGRPTYSEGRAHPYRERWWRWHFWAGLVGGTFALAWALSGFFANNPWQLFSPAAPAKVELARYLGGPAPAVVRGWRPERLEAPADAAVVELQWAHVGGSAVLLAHTRDGRRVPQPAHGASAGGLGDAVLTAAVRRLAGGVAIAGQGVVGAYDGDYYLRHHRDAADRPLPALRVDLADAARTRLYLDAQDGRVLLRTDRSRRVSRWLYSALHHWDFGWLHRRPLWDAWMVAWIAAGLVLSVSSVVLGWRRLAVTARRLRRRAAAAPPPVEPELRGGIEAG